MIKYFLPVSPVFETPGVRHLPCDFMDFVLVYGVSSSIKSVFVRSILHFILIG